jgi:site-specific DNA recombinase
VDELKEKRQKLQHGMERLIDSLAEGMIDKDQFTARMNRTRARIADLEAKIAAQTSDEGRQAHSRSVRSRLAEISSHVQNQLSDVDWTAKRDIIRALIQRIEIGPMKIAVVFRLPTDNSARALEPIIVTLSRV